MPAVTFTNSTNTTSDAWSAWVDDPSATATTTWRYWITGSATANYYWLNWNRGGTTLTTGGATEVGYAFVQQPAPVSAEEAAAAADRARVMRAEADERMARQQADHLAAVQRAETLLHEHLTIRQRRSLKANGQFRVRTPSGRCYEIGRGHHANVFQLNADGKRTHRLCVYPEGGLPEADCMLAQKLHLEANEEQLRQVAHITPLGSAIPEVAAAAR